MILIIIEFLIVLTGLAVTPFLFYRIPKLPELNKETMKFPSVSIIIPARNEEHNLPLILKDLCHQSFTPFEIICVDDDSYDLTAQIAETYGVRVISLHDKPDDWIGKSWACQNGADCAKGELLLFLDADVRLGNDGIYRLMQMYCHLDCTISVQPFHKTKEAYEQLSIIFNFIQIAANGTALKNSPAIGLYGPVILISQSDYSKIGGHKSVRKSIVEDMSLANRLKKANIPYRVFVGDTEISFRMYANGLKSLLRGWIKNIATGASKTPPRVLWMIFFWIASLISTPIHVVVFAISLNIIWFLIYSLLYITWVVILILYSKSIGQFRIWALIFYPILMIVFLSILAISIFKKIFGLKIIWKDRTIAKEDM